MITTLLAGHCVSFLCPPTGTLCPADTTRSLRDRRNPNFAVHRCNRINMCLYSSKEHIAVKLTFNVEHIFVRDAFALLVFRVATVNAPVMEVHLLDDEVLTWYDYSGRLVCRQFATCRINKIQNGNINNNFLYKLKCVILFRELIKYSISILPWNNQPMYELYGLETTLQSRTTSFPSSISPSTSPAPSDKLTRGGSEFIKRDHTNMKTVNLLFINIMLFIFVFNSFKTMRPKLETTSSSCYHYECIWTRGILNQIFNLFVEINQVNTHSERRVSRPVPVRCLESLYFPPDRQQFCRDLRLWEWMLEHSAHRRCRCFAPQLGFFKSKKAIDKWRE